MAENGIVFKSKGNWLWSLDFNFVLSSWQVKKQKLFSLYLLWNKWSEIWYLRFFLKYFEYDGLGITSYAQLIEGQVLIFCLNYILLNLLTLELNFFLKLSLIGKCKLPWKTLLKHVKALRFEKGKKTRG